MFNKDKRSLILSVALGDGCLHYTSNKRSAALTVDHCLDQADWASWKASLVSSAAGRDIKMRQGHKGKSIQFSLCMLRIKAWRKWLYPHNKKDKTRFIRFIRHPELALAIWLGDDGYSGIEGRLRLFICDQSLEQALTISEWLNVTFDTKSVVKMQNSKKKAKSYPFIKWTQEDSLKIWQIIRPKLVEFKSMRNKFKHIEHKYQVSLLQLPTRK